MEVVLNTASQFTAHYYQVQNSWEASEVNERLAERIAVLQVLQILTAMHATLTNTSRNLNQHQQLLVPQNLLSQVFWNPKEIKYLEGKKISKIRVRGKMILWKI